MPWFIVVKFYLKKSAENYHVREWATNKLVGAHDNSSAGYKHDIPHLDILLFSLVIMSVTCSNPGIRESQQSSNLASLGLGDGGELGKLRVKVDCYIALMT